MKAQFRYVLFIVTILFSLCALAQRETGSVSGTVTDPSGAVVPNAKVTITSSATGLTRAVTTNANGFYNATTLALGRTR